MELPEGYRLDYGDADNVVLLNECGWPCAVFTPEDTTTTIAKVAWYQKNRQDAGARAEVQRMAKPRGGERHEADDKTPRPA